MIDRDQLREALSRMADKVYTGDREDWPDHVAVVEAARLVADPDTLVLKWCEEHDMQQHPKNKRLCWWFHAQEWAGRKPKPCRFAKRILLAPVLEGQPK